MAILNHLLLVSSLVPLVLSYPFYPPTCYTKVLSMSRELTQWAAFLKWDPETRYCMAHMPDLLLDVHYSVVVPEFSALCGILTENLSCKSRRDTYCYSCRMQNACVMYKMRTYISLVEGLRDRRCAYTRDVSRMGVTLRQLFIIMAEKCHGDLVFTIYDCAALER